MSAGAITSYIDVAQMTLYAFWLFFAGLVYYLRAEDKREGYPLVSDNPRPRVKIEGLPFTPKPKTFLMRDGSTVQAPAPATADSVGNMSPSAPWSGAPLIPNGDPMQDGVGAAAYAMRATKPDLCHDGSVRIVPMRADAELSVAEEGPDPRGMDVVGADGKVGGKVVDIWVDRADMLPRYLEVEAGGKRVLLPSPLAKVSGGRVMAISVKGEHFAKAPTTAQPEQVTLREEDRISAYFGSGHLYALPERSEPLI